MSTPNGADISDYQGMNYLWNFSGFKMYRIIS